MVLVMACYHALGVCVSWTGKFMILTLFIGNLPIFMSFITKRMKRLNIWVNFSQPYLLTVACGVAMCQMFYHFIFSKL